MHIHDLNSIRMRILYHVMCHGTHGLVNRRRRGGFLGVRGGGWRRSLLRRSHRSWIAGESGGKLLPTLLQNGHIVKQFSFWV